jgi:hypothetical protein
MITRRSAGMKKIVDGKLYSTGSAECLGSYTEGYATDFDHIDESLYRTTSGAYFLAGEGGAMTIYATEGEDHMTSGGKGLRPISEAEAREWMELHCTAEEYVEAFGAPASA